MIRARTSKNYIFVIYNGQSYMLCLGDFQTKSILYSTRKKLLAGKIDILISDNSKTIQIICTVGKPFEFKIL